VGGLTRSGAAFLVIGGSSMSDPEVKSVYLLFLKGNSILDTENSRVPKKHSQSQLRQGLKVRISPQPPPSFFVHINAEDETFPLMRFETGMLFSAFPVSISITYLLFYYKWRLTLFFIVIVCMTLYPFLHRVNK
jgi:hypothetical protein